MLFTGCVATQPTVPAYVDQSKIFLHVHSEGSPIMEIKYDRAERCFAFLDIWNGSKDSKDAVNNLIKFECNSYRINKGLDFQGVSIGPLNQRLEARFMDKNICEHMRKAHSDANELWRFEC